MFPNLRLIFRKRIPYTTRRVKCKDEGIVLRYVDGQYSCDFSGAREATVNQEKGLYYLFYDDAGKDGRRVYIAVSEGLRKDNENSRDIFIYGISGE